MLEGMPGTPSDPSYAEARARSPQVYRDVEIVEDPEVPSYPTEDGPVVLDAARASGSRAGRMFPHAVVSVALVLVGVGAFILMVTVDGRWMQGAAGVVVGVAVFGLLAVGALARSEQALAAEALMQAAAFRDAAASVRVSIGPHLVEGPVVVKLTHASVRYARRGSFPEDDLAVPLEELAATLRLNQAQRTIWTLVKSGRALEALTLSSATDELAAAIDSALVVAQRRGQRGAARKPARKVRRPVDPPPAGGPGF